MRLEQLEYLILISKEKSFNAASEHLNISHQALNTSIKNLEDEVGVPLIHRTPRGLSLTQAGARMVQFSREMLKNYYALLDELRQTERQTVVQSVLQGSLSIYATSAYTISILPDTIKNFKLEQKEVTTLLYVLDAKTIITRIAEKRKNSVGFINIPDHEKDNLTALIKNQGLQFYPLFRSNMCFCASHASPLAQKGKQSLSTLTKYPIVMLASAQDDQTDITFYSDFLKKTKIALSTSSYAIWLDAVMQNVGIGMLYDIILQQNSALVKDLDKITIISTREKLSATMGYVTDTQPSELVTAFIEFFTKLNPPQL